MSSRLFFLLLGVPSLAVLIGLDIDSATYRLSVIESSKKNEPMETLRDRVEESTCISFAEEGRRFDDSPNRMLPSNSTVCSYFPLFHTQTGFSQPSASALTSEHWTQSSTGGFSTTINSAVWSSEELLATLLEHIREKVEGKYKGKEIEYVAAVPRAWSAAQRESFLQVAKVAKMKVVSLVHRTQAIALSYMLTRADVETPQTSLIFHLGRDSLEVAAAASSIRRLSKQKLVPVIQLLSAVTVDSINARTLDSLIADHLVTQFETTHKISLAGDTAAKQKLAQKTSEVRRTLMNKDQITVSEELKGKLLKYTMKSSELKSLVKSLKPAITAAIDQTLSLSDLVRSNFTNLLIVGEDSRNSVLQDILQEGFTMRLPMILHEETSVARGAGYFGTNLTSQYQLKTMWVVDVVPAVTVSCEAIGGDGKMSAEVFGGGAAFGTKKTVAFVSEKSLKCRVVSGKEGHETALFEFSSTGAEEFTKENGKTPSQQFTFLYNSHGIIQLDSARLILADQLSVFQDLQLKVTDLGTQKPLSESRMQEIEGKLKAQKDSDGDKRQTTETRIKMQNTIRAYRAMLHDKGFHRVTTEEERKSLATQVTAADEWLNSAEGKTAQFKVITEKFVSLQAVFAPAHERMQEAKTRPDTLKNAYSQVAGLNATMVGLNMTKEWLPIEEREAVFKELQTVKDWIAGIEKEQREKNPWEALSVKAADIQARVLQAAKSVEKIQKAVKPKPPPPVIEKKETSSGTPEEVKKPQEPKKKSPKDEARKKRARTEL